MYLGQEKSFDQTEKVKQQKVYAQVYQSCVGHWVPRIKAECQYGQAEEYESHYYSHCNEHVHETVTLQRSRAATIKYWC